MIQKWDKNCAAGRKYFPQKWKCTSENRRSNVTTRQADGLHRTDHYGNPGIERSKECRLAGICFWDIDQLTKACRRNVFTFGDHFQPGQKNRFVCRELLFFLELTNNKGKNFNEAENKLLSLSHLNLVRYSFPSSVFNLKTFPEATVDGCLRPIKICIDLYSIIIQHSHIVKITNTGIHFMRMISQIVVHFILEALWNSWSRDTADYITRYVQWLFGIHLSASVECGENVPNTKTLFVHHKASQFIRD